MCSQYCSEKISELAHQSEQEHVDNYRQFESMVKSMIQKMEARATRTFDSQESCEAHYKSAVENVLYMHGSNANKMSSKKWDGPNGKHHYSCE